MSTPLYNRTFLRLCLGALLFVFLCPLLQAGEITEGREFYFGIPCCKKPTGEGARGVPLQLWISSRTDNTVTIEAPATGFAQTHKLTANTVKIISLPEGLMNTENEIKHNSGIHITAQSPVAAALYVSYKVTGEACALRPVGALGKKYLAMSLYQDQTDEFKPGQILIVATQDNTKVTYIPSAATGRVKANKTGSVTLNKGETFLILGLAQPSFNQDALTDLTGTSIEANKPIAVMSGHTKGAFPRFSSTMLSIPANFMRNMLIDQMPPLEVLGTTYVVAPIQYTNRPFNGNDVDGEGDYMRFVAAEDNTSLSVVKPDGSSRILAQGMREGEVYDIVTLKESAVYSSNKPMLAAQYGKAWRVSVVSPIISPDGGFKTDAKKEDIANPSRNGEGMMFTLTPESQWASRAIFRSPEGMNNFINITLRTIHVDSVKFNGKYLRAVFGSKVREIPGTPYSFIAAINTSGEHRIEADPGTHAKFTAYVYGNYDATKDGFAYGYPVGVNYALQMPQDSIVVTTANISCTTDKGFVTIVHTDEFAGLYDIYLSPQSSNYTLTLSAPIEPSIDKINFTLEVIDPSKNADGVVYIVDRTGQRIERTFSYRVEAVAANRDNVNFGVVALGSEACKEIILSNPTGEPIEIMGIELTSSNATFSIASPTVFPLTLPAGEALTVNVCSKALTIGVASNSVLVRLACYSRVISTLTLTSIQARVTMNDWSFGEVPIDTEKSHEVTIENVSTDNVLIELTAVDWDDKVHFRTEGLLDKLPISLPMRGSKFTFTVFYKPTEVNAPNMTNAVFTGSTTTTKLNSQWSGVGIQPTSVNESESLSLRLFPIAPQPLTGFGTVQYSIASAAPVTLSLYTILGERVLVLNEGMQAAGEYTKGIDVSTLPPGAYLCRLDAGGQSATQTLIIK